MSASDLRVLLAVYPHPALLRLVEADRRLPYKVQNIRRYWPTLNRSERRQQLDQVWRQIPGALSSRMAKTDLPLHGIEDMPSAPTKMLKGLEDALDALVCAWVGIEYLAFRCTAYGDETAAIWVPAAGGPPEV